MTDFHALAAAARPLNDDEWGSERQIAAENAFTDAALTVLTQDQLDDIWHKATTEEGIAGTLAAITRRTAMTEHTKGPIEAERDGNGHLALWTGNTNLLVEGMLDREGLPTEEREENARRLVACWNACQGIETDALEGVSLKGVLDVLETNRRAGMEPSTVAREAITKLLR
jgi:hypothetical protein